MKQTLGWNQGKIGYDQRVSLPAVTDRLEQPRHRMADYARLTRVTARRFWLSVAFGAGVGLVLGLAVAPLLGLSHWIRHADPADARSDWLLILLLPTVGFALVVAFAVGVHWADGHYGRRIELRREGRRIRLVGATTVSIPRKNVIRTTLEPEPSVDGAFRFTVYYRTRSVSGAEAVRVRSKGVTGHPWFLLVEDLELAKEWQRKLEG